MDRWRNGGYFDQYLRVPGIRALDQAQGLLLAYGVTTAGRDQADAGDSDFAGAEVIADFMICHRPIAVTGAKAGKTLAFGLLSDAAEECGERFVQPAQRVAEEYDGDCLEIRH